MNHIKNDTMFMIVVVLGCLAGSAALWQRVASSATPRVVHIEAPPVAAAAKLADTEPASTDQETASELDGGKQSSYAG